MSAIGQPRAFSLLPHPVDPDPGSACVRAVCSRSARGDLVIRYRMEGFPGGVAVPPFAAGRRLDGLWRHTCCEAFVRCAGTPAYREFNFSPSGAWAAYDFSGYRRGGRDAAVSAPRIGCRREGDALDLEAVVRGLDLPGEGSLRLGLAVVVEHGAGDTGHWALAHPAAQPDFHHPRAFAATLDNTAPGDAAACD